ncbi:uncharacterized protein TNCV_1573481 [Trichonephila clavipes]|nr:uncharacterized protein TNCV_1573481 [Trichonephila clavipes]
MTTLCYRVRAAVGVRQIFSVQALLSCPVASWCTRNDGHYRVRAAVGVRHRFRRGTTLLSGCLVARGTMTTTSYRGRATVGFRHPFFVETLPCCPVASWCTRNDGNDILPQALSGGCSSLFSVEALLCCPVASCCTRNDDNDMLPHPRGGGCASPFFRRGTTLLSGRVLVHAER